MSKLLALITINTILVSPAITLGISFVNNTEINTSDIIKEKNDLLNNKNDLLDKIDIDSIVKEYNVTGNVTKNLSDGLIERNLGEIYVGTNSKPTAKQIKIALINNRNFDLDANAFKVTDISSTDAKIVGDGVKYSGEAAVIFKITNFKKIIEKNMLSFFGHEEEIWHSAIDNNGQLYFATSFSNIYRSNGKDSFTKIGHIDNLIIYALTIGNDGNIYVAGVGPSFESKEELVIYQSNGKEQFRPIKWKVEEKEDILSLVTDKDNNVYVGTNMGKIYQSKDRRQFKLIEHLDGAILSLLADKNNNIYARTINNKIYQNKNQSDFQLIKELDTNIFASTINQDGNLYLIVGNQEDEYQVVVCQDNNKGMFREIETLKIKNLIKSLAIDNNDNLYATTLNNIYRSDNDKKFNLMKGLKNSYFSLTLDSNNNVFVGTNEGDIYRSDAVINQQYPIDDIDINYQYNKNGQANWNYSLNFDDEKTFSIIKYDKYAYNWNDFVKNNNYSVLYLKGLDVWAESNATFGKTSKLYPNLLPFKDEFSINLSNIKENNDENNPYEVVLYDVSSAIFSAYSVKVKCYLQFFIDKESKELKVNLKTKNYLWSAGSYNRKLQVHLKLDAFTFFPNKINI